MKMKEEKALDRYCHQAQKACPPAFRRRLAQDLREHAAEFADAAPTRDIAQFIEQAGTPAQFAENFTACLSPAEQQRLIHRRHRARTASLVIGGVLLALVLALCLYIFIESDPFATYTEIISAIHIGFKCNVRKVI